MKATLLTGLPPGDAGTFHTIGKMVELARHVRPEVAELAQMMVAGAPPDEAAARLFFFVRDRIQNMPDPDGIEWLQAPHVTLVSPVGDCDDKALLLAAFFVAVGIPVRYVAIGPRSPKLSHVYVEGQIAGRWWAFDPKNLAAEPGWAWPNPVRIERVPV